MVNVARFLKALSFRLHQRAMEVQPGLGFKGKQYERAAQSARADVLTDLAAICSETAAEIEQSED